MYEVNGMEFDSPRARLELINEVLEGRVNEEEVLHMISRCTTCLRCKKACPHSIEVPVIIQEFKTMQKKGSKDKEKFLNTIGYPPKVVEDFTKTGNPFGRKQERIDVRGKNHNEEWILFPGCMTQEYKKESVDNISKILKKIGIKFFVVDACCFSPLKNFGFSKEELAGLFNEKYKNVKKFRVITPCPGCLNALKELHGIEAYHITEIIEKNLHRLKLENRIHAVIHDPCKLGRYQKIFDAPRNILKNIKGLKLKEFEKNKEDSMCCGAGGGFPSIEPELSNKMAKRIVESRTDKIDYIVTSCPTCYLHILKNSDGRVKYITDLIAESMK